MYQAYLFDLDGTLVDTAPDLHEALNTTLAQWKFSPVAIGITRRWVGHGGKQMLSHALEELKHVYSEELVDEMYEAFLQHYLLHIAQLSRPYLGVRACLQYFHQLQIPLGVVTNKRIELAQPLLEALNLAQFFQIVVGGNTLAVMKPDPAPLLHACQVLNVAPVDTLYVGDSLTDVRCARAARCPIALFADGYNEGRDPSTMAVDQVISSFLDLI